MNYNFYSSKQGSDFEMAVILTAILPPMFWGCGYIIQFVLGAAS